MLRFLPHDADFCFASVLGNDDDEKHRLVMGWLEQWLRFQYRIGVRGAVVFDIDDTLLDHDENIIAPVLRIYSLSKHLGFKRAIITARPETRDNREYTIQTLREKKIGEWESLYMMPESRAITIESISAYKREARDDLETRHRIVANIGDMWHDLVRMPLHHGTRCLESMQDDSCCILFPPMSHGEVAVKLVSRARERSARIKMEANAQSHE